jgi:hypothetical protein
MDDPLFGVTETARARIWAEFQQLNHSRRNKQVGWTQCIRDAYIVAARELPHELAVALVVHYGRQLGWLETWRRPTHAPVPIRGFSTIPPPPVQWIPEEEQQATILKLVADLIRGTPPAIEERAAEPITSESLTPKQKRARELFNQIQGRHPEWGLQTIADRLRVKGRRVSDDTLSRCMRQPSKVRGLTMDSVIEALQRLASE